MFPNRFLQHEKEAEQKLDNNNKVKFLKSSKVYMIQSEQLSQAAEETI